MNKKSEFGFITAPVLNLVDGNRPLTTNVKKIAHAMMHPENDQVDGFLAPIIVDKNTKMIVDGQHRYFAAMELWKESIPYALSVCYYDFSNPLLAAIHFNNTSKRWTQENYVQAWIADGKKQYQLLKSFVHDCPELSYKTALELIYGKSCATVISGGTLKLNEVILRQAKIYYAELCAMADATKCELFFKTGIPTAWMKSRKNILADDSKQTWNKWLKALKSKFKVPGSNKSEFWIQEFYRIQSKMH